MPKRIQRRRTKGYRLPERAVSVTRPGRFGNPYRVGIDCADAAGAVRLFEAHLKMELHINPNLLEPLRGRDLACFCPLEGKNGEPVPCHADVLLRYANGGLDTPLG